MNEIAGLCRLSTRGDAGDALFCPAASWESMPTEMCTFRSVWNTLRAQQQQSSKFTGTHSIDLRNFAGFRGSELHASQTHLWTRGACMCGTIEGTHARWVTNQCNSQLVVKSAHVVSKPPNILVLQTASQLLVTVTCRP